MNRQQIIAIVMAILIVGSGVGFAMTGGVAAQDDDDEDEPKSDESYNYEVKLTEKNQQQLVRAQPAQLMEHSLERQNLINRYEYLNDDNNVHHVYLMDEGQVMGYYVAQGKVSSLNSKLTNNKQIVEVQRARFDDWGAAGPEGANFKVVESPQMDGSYGSNGEGIFFFTTSGEYVETDLDYVVSEEPLSIQDEVILKEEVDDETDE